MHENPYGGYGTTTGLGPPLGHQSVVHSPHSGQMNMMPMPPDTSFGWSATTNPYVYKVN